MSNYQLINASAHQTGLPDKSVHMVCTSPPYMALRKYEGEQDIEWPEVSYSPMPGLPPITIAGCAVGCNHEWAKTPDKQVKITNGTGASTLGGGRESWGDRNSKDASGGVCIHCGGMRCGLGAEPTISAYIGHLMLVMKEMHRVLRDDGLAFVNLSDTYAASRPGGQPAPTNTGNRTGYLASKKQGVMTLPPGLKPKNLMLIPQRFVLACQADGWIVRSALPWLKRNGMPDSCEDRPSQVVESIFLLAKSERYFFDMDAVKMPTTGKFNDFPSHKSIGSGTGRKRYDDNQNAACPSGHVGVSESGMRNFRSSDLFFKTWQGLVSSDDGEPLAMVVNTKSYSGSHFACFPLDIPLTCIRAGTSERGCCPKCLAPYERVTENSGGNWEKRKAAGAPMRYGMNNNKGEAITNYGGSQSITTGWQPGCVCNAGEPIEATVLDCFSGSGTTGRAALQLNRNYIGVDISQTYNDDLAPVRMGNVQIELVSA